MEAVARDEESVAKVGRTHELTRTLWHARRFLGGAYSEFGLSILSLQAVVFEDCGGDEVLQGERAAPGISWSFVGLKGCARWGSGEASAGVPEAS